MAERVRGSILSISGVGAFLPETMSEKEIHEQKQRHVVLSHVYSNPTKQQHSIKASSWFFEQQLALSVTNVTRKACFCLSSRTKCCSACIICYTPIYYILHIHPITICCTPALTRRLATCWYIIDYRRESTME